MNGVDINFLIGELLTYGLIIAVVVWAAKKIIDGFRKKKKIEA